MYPGMVGFVRHGSRKVFRTIEYLRWSSLSRALRVYTLIVRQKKHNLRQKIYKLSLKFINPFKMYHKSLKDDILQKVKHPLDEQIVPNQITFTNPKVQFRKSQLQVTEQTGRDLIKAITFKLIKSERSHLLTSESRKDSAETERFAHKMFLKDFTTRFPLNGNFNFECQFFTPLGTV